MAEKLKPVDPDSDEAAEIWDEFSDSVNMTPSEIESWLETDESKSVGQPGGAGGETVGRDSAKRILRIKDRKKSELSGEDYAHMKKVNGYVARHLKQRPEARGEELARTDWAYSLKNWGHDPLK